MMLFEDTHQRQPQCGGIYQWDFMDLGGLTVGTTVFLTDINLK